MTSRIPSTPTGELQISKGSLIALCTQNHNVTYVAEGLLLGLLACMHR